jgi:hypothetical protein
MYCPLLSREDEVDPDKICGTSRSPDIVDVGIEMLEKYAPRIAEGKSTPYSLLSVEDITWSTPKTSWHSVSNDLE